MQFKLKDITLRTVTLDDLNEVSRMWNFEKGEISENDALKAIEWMSNNHNQNQIHNITHLCFGIFHNETNRIIGWCGLDGRNSNIDNKVNIFYLVDKEFRNRGYATECAFKLLEYGLSHMQLDRIDGACSIDNIGSQKVMERIGMKRGQDDDGHHYFMTLDYYSQIYGY